MKNIKTTATLINGAIYIEDTVRKALNLENGDRLNLEVLDDVLTIKPYLDITNWANNYLHIHELRGFYKIGRDRVAGITTVILVNGRVGVAQCDPNDAFEDVVGEAIALARALGEEDKIPKEVFG